MTKDEYCIEVCGGKCCKVFDSKKTLVWQCPHQLKNGACGVFSEWKNRGTCGKHFPEVGNTAMRIEEAIRRKLLPKWIEDQCVYAHPELLEVDYANGS